MAISASIRLMIFDVIAHAPLAMTAEVRGRIPGTSWCLAALS
jgi:hypothetical protein